MKDGLCGRTPVEASAQISAVKTAGGNDPVRILFDLMDGSSDPFERFDVRLRIKLLFEPVVLAESVEHQFLGEAAVFFHDMMRIHIQLSAVHIDLFLHGCLGLGFVIDHHDIARGFVTQDQVGHAGERIPRKGGDELLFCGQNFILFAKACEG